MTQETKFTPGPWYADGDDPAELIVWSSPENRICFLAHSAGFNSDGDFANANLVAAAPEMYAALEALVIETVDYMQINNLGDPEQKHNIKLARKALSKARGEQP